ncbi:hypothetical protein FACS189454_07920 [Planctomycetales bacterium]|nr:hypothetical protein FACS189454_07920 [Planctomycetales bacterium]
MCSQNKFAMTKILFFITVLILFFVVNLSADEPAAKPTREMVIAFIEKGMNEPLTEEEKQLAPSKRKHVDIAEQFGNDFTGLDFSHIEWGGYLSTVTRILFANGSTFSQCQFTESTIYGGRLNHCRFDRADLTDAFFYSCKFDHADFSNAKLMNTRFNWCSFKNTNFSYLELPSCTLWGCDFSNADVSGTNFSGVEFSCFHETFEAANATGANFSTADLSDANFRKACLKNVCFSSAKLYRADFTGANLEGADFMGANLYAAIFDDVSGIDKPTRQNLEKRAARWLYQLHETIYDVWQMIWIYVFFLIFIILCIQTVWVVRKKRYSYFYYGAFGCNAVAVFSTLSTLVMLLIMIFTGAHPVRQMSGDMEIWSAWFHFFPIPGIGLLLANAVSYLLFIIFLLTLLFRRRYWSFSLFCYLLLTALHCFLAFRWLGLFMPDA